MYNYITGYDIIQDNCEEVFNPDQSDMDRDGVGGACDNCLQLFNPDQMNSDNDETGNECDPDDDNDGIGRSFHLVRVLYNILQFLFFQLTSTITARLLSIVIKGIVIEIGLEISVTTARVDQIQIRLTLMEMAWGMHATTAASTLILNS